MISVIFSLFVKRNIYTVLIRYLYGFYIVALPFFDKKITFFHVKKQKWYAKIFHMKLDALR